MGTALVGDVPIGHNILVSATYRMSLVSMANGAGMSRISARAGANISILSKAQSQDISARSKSTGNSTILQASASAINRSCNYWWGGARDKLQSNRRSWVTNFDLTSGFDNSPTKELKEAGLNIFRVPSYSPSSIAEFALSGMLALSKKVQLSYVNSKEANFRIDNLECLLLETRT